MTRSLSPPTSFLSSSSSLNYYHFCSSLGKKILQKHYIPTVIIITMKIITFSLLVLVTVVGIAFALAHPTPHQSR